MKWSAARTFGLLVGLLLAGLIGMMGRAIHLLTQAQRQAAHALQDTQGSWAKSQDALRLSEDERTRLAHDFDALKEQWGKSEADLTQRSQELQERKTASEAFSAERAEAAKQLEASQQQRRELEQTLKQAQQQVEVERSGQRALTDQLDRAKSQALTREELEQLSHAVDAEHAEQQRLSDWVEELSRAYEQLAWDRPAEPALRDKVVSARKATPAGRTVRAYVDDQATLRRQMGDAYLAMGLYEKAAQCFEQSLQLQDDPQLHGVLAVLYERYLRDPVRAEAHALQRGQPNPPSEAVALPRKDWPLIRDWLSH